MGCRHSNWHAVNQLAHDAAMSQAVRSDDLRIAAGGLRRDSEGLAQRSRNPSVIIRADKQGPVLGSTFRHPFQAYCKAWGDGQEKPLVLLRHAALGAARHHQAVAL